MSGPLTTHARLLLLKEGSQRKAIITNLGLAVEVFDLKASPGDFVELFENQAKGAGFDDQAIVIALNTVFRPDAKPRDSLLDPTGNGIFTKIMEKLEDLTKHVFSLKCFPLTHQPPRGSGVNPPPDSTS